MIAIQITLEAEMVAIRPYIQHPSTESFAESLLIEGWLAGQHCVLVLSGMGRIRAEQALSYVIERYHPSALISLGFSGALAPKLRVGTSLSALK